MGVCVELEDIISVILWAKVQNGVSARIQKLKVMLELY